MGVPKISPSITDSQRPSIPGETEGRKNPMNPKLATGITLIVLGVLVVAAAVILSFCFGMFLASIILSVTSGLMFLPGIILAILGKEGFLIENNKKSVSPSITNNQTTSQTPTSLEDREASSINDTPPTSLSPSAEGHSNTHYPLPSAPLPVEKESEYSYSDFTYFGKHLKLGKPATKEQREEILNEIKNGNVHTPFFYPELRNDKEIIEALIDANGGYELKEASDELTQDRALVLKAFEKDVHSLKYAHPTLKKDYEFMLELIKKKRVAVKYASLSLRKDEHFIWAATEKSGSPLFHASETLKTDRTIALKFVTRRGQDLRYLKNFQDDEEIVRAATQNDASAISFASDRVKKLLGS